MVESGAIEVAHARRPMRGETACGDDFIVVRTGDAVLVGLTDGLGHGPLAAEASAVFCRSVEAEPGLPIDALMRRAHADLRGTRGVAGALLRLDGRTARATFAGIGNIELSVLGGTTDRPISLPGVLGQRMRKVRPFDFTLSPPATLILHTDGVSSRHGFGELLALEVEALARACIHRFGKDHDDAGCVVVRLGGTPARPRMAGAWACDESTFEALQASDAVWISQRAARLAADAGLGTVRGSSVAIAVSELVTNAVKYAGGGRVTVRTLDAQLGVEIVVEDDGPGIPDVEAALVDGYTEGRLLTVDHPRTGRGLGCGLGAVRRLSDDLRIENREPRGLRVTLRVLAR